MRTKLVEMKSPFSVLVNQWLKECGGHGRARAGEHKEQGGSVGRRRGKNAKKQMKPRLDESKERSGEGRMGEDRGSEVGTS